MKLIKLSDTHYIVVDNSEIKESFDGYCLDDERNIRHGRSDLHTLSLSKKITYSTQPELLGNGWMQSVKPLLLSEVEEAINGYSTYELFKKVDGTCEKGEYEHWLFEQGFNAHKELVKDKLFTVEDIVNAYELGIEDSENVRLFGKKDVIAKFRDTIEKSLLHQTEWEVTFDEQGKLKLI